MNMDNWNIIATVRPMSSALHQIVTILEQKLLSIRLDSENEMYYESGQTQLLNKLQQCINEKKPIRFLLPAFPCKSPNMDKVSSKLPDAAEYYALQYLNDTCAEIDAIHQHGCELMIWSDGRVFGDLVGVSDQEIATYESILRDYTSTMTHLRWDNLTNYIGHSQADQLIEKYGSKNFDFQQWLNKCEDNHRQFIHLRRFMETDSGKRINRQNLSRRQLQNQMGLIAEKMIRRNEALTHLLKSNYPDHIRFSIHQHVNNGEKFTIGLYRRNEGSNESRSFLRTPWHNTLVIGIDGQMTLMPHNQVDLQNEHMPIMFQNQIWCFVQLPSSSQGLRSLKVTLESVKPHGGLMIDLNGQVRLDNLDMKWMKMLYKIFGKCQITGRPSEQEPAQEDAKGKIHDPIRYHCALDDSQLTMNKRRPFFYNRSISLEVSCG